MFYKITFLFSFVPVLCLSLLTVTGCKNNNPYNTIVVKGKISIDGIPAEGVSVLFNPRNGNENAAGGLTDKDGNYTLTTGAAPVGSGTVAGEYDVTLSKIAIQGVELSMEEYAKKYGNQRPQTIYLIPEKYSSAAESGFAPVKVEKGKDNTFDFDIKTK